MYAQKIHQDVKFADLCSVLSIHEDDISTTTMSEVNIIFDALRKLVVKEGWGIIPAVIIAIHDEAHRLIVPGGLRYNPVSHVPHSVHQQSFMNFCLEDLGDDSRGRHIK